MLIRSGYPLQSFFANANIKNNKNQAKKGFPLLSLLQKVSKKTITSYKYAFHLHHSKPIREQ